MANSTLLFDLTAKGYAKSPVRDQESYEKKLEITRSYLTPEMEVMEFGCGTGSTAIAHAPYAKRILATDASGNMIEIARAKAAEANTENVTFEQADIASMTLADSSYDMIMGHSILHLLKDKDAAIAKVYRALKPGGTFASSTACLGESSFGIKLLTGLISVLPLMPPIRSFSKDHLRSAIAHVGFEIVHDWAPHGGPVLFLIARRPLADA